jgi:hypothetical protein
VAVGRYPPPAPGDRLHEQSQLVTARAYQSQVEVGVHLDEIDDAVVQLPLVGGCHDEAGPAPHPGRLVRFHGEFQLPSRRRRLRQLEGELGAGPADVAGLVPHAGETSVHVFANLAGGQDLEADAGLHGERQHIEKAEPLAPGKRDLLRDAGKRERREGAPTLQLLDDQ